MVSPISGSNNTTLLKVLDTEEIAQRWYKQLGIDVGNTFRSIDKLEYWMCNDTGLRWYEPLEAAASSHIYSQLEKYEWYYMPEKWEFVKSINSFSPNSTVLEIGSGRGYFIELAQKNVFKSLEKYLPLQVVSIEYEPLASYHVEWAVNGYLKGLLTPLFPKLITRLIFNRYTTLPITLPISFYFTGWIEKIFNRTYYPS
jgi:hypothetical protein